MRLILRQREVLPDPWRYSGEASSAAEPLIVPWLQLQSESASWEHRTAPLGTRLAPADAVEALTPFLARLSLIALELPSVGDGRGYSQARVLRGRLGFRGELRAVGPGVRPDQAFLLARCGFDSLEPPAGVDPEALRLALGRYDVAYQPGAPQVELRRQRFPAP
ncbi:MAG TPA: DUF934 domain-containing protein [Steroidobacteraceae bacterium]|nr:DUF934 domain-containing protein [Steroidobacteraceae bacterium]